MNKQFVIKVVSWSGQVLLAFIIALPIYTHFFDLFSYLVDKGENKQVRIECKKNQVVALAELNGTDYCIQRPYGLALGTPPRKDQQSFLEELPLTDTLSIEACECLINLEKKNELKRFNIAQEKLTSKYPWSAEKPLLITGWYCVDNDNPCFERFAHDS